MSFTAATSAAWLQPQGIAQTCFGGCLFTINMIAGTAVLIAMRRRNVAFIMVGTMIIVDAIYGLGQFFSGIYALRLDADDNDNASTVLLSDWTCTIQIKNLVLLFTAPLIAFMPWALSVERLLAVFWPIKYRIYGRHYSFGLIVLGISVSLAWFIGTLTDNYFSKEMVPATCSLSLVLGPVSGRLLPAFRITLTTLDVIAYIPIVLTMNKKIKIIMVNSGAPNPINENQQQIFAKKLNRSAALNAVNTFILFQIPDVYLFIWSAGVSLDTTIFLSMLTCRGIVSTLIFVCGNREIREAVLRKFRLLSSIGHHPSAVANAATQLPKQSSPRSQFHGSSLPP